MALNLIKTCHNGSNPNTNEWFFFHGIESDHNLPQWRQSKHQQMNFFMDELKFLAPLNRAKPT
jgi:hypothetical protein